MLMFTKRSLPLLLVMLLCTLNATASRGTKNWYFGSFSSDVISKLGNGATPDSHKYYTFSDLTDVSFDADNLRDLQFTAKAKSMRIFVDPSTGTSTDGIMLFKDNQIKVPVCKGEQVVFTLKSCGTTPCSFTWKNVDESGEPVDSFTASGNARPSTSASTPYTAKAKANGYIILANTDPKQRLFYVSNISREPQEKSFAFSATSTTVDLPSCYDAASHGFMAKIPASTSNGVETVTYSVRSRNGVVFEQKDTAVVDSIGRLRLINTGKVELTANVTYLDSTTTTATTTLNVTAADLTYVTPENGSENTFTVSNFKYDDDTDAPIAAEGIVSHVYNNVPGITFTTVATSEQVTVVKRIGNNDYGLIDIDSNGYTFPFKPVGSGYATMGTVFKFSPMVKGKLSFSGYFLSDTKPGSKVQLYDDKGTALGGSHDFTTSKVTISDIELTKGKDYYLYTGQQTDEFALTEFTFEPSYKFYKTTVDGQQIPTTAAVADSTGITSWETITLESTMQAAGSCSAIPFGNVKSVMVDDKTGAITKITYKDGISDKEKGGAILVIANSDTYGQASYILTIPYTAHKWNFYNSIKAAHNSDKSGFDINKSNINPNYDDWHVTYEVREYDAQTRELTKLNGAVLANARQLYYDNAYYVNETAGLLMLGTPLSFGVQTKISGASDMSLADSLNATPDQVESCNLISFSKGSKISIPAHDGDFIKLYFCRHAAGSGSNVAITNATDLNGKEFTADKPLKITKWNDKNVDNPPRGCYIIKAKLTKSDDPYVHLTVADHGWTAIASIEVAQDSMASDMKLSKGQDSRNAFTAKNNSYVRPTSNNDYQFVVSYGGKYSDVPIATVNKATLTTEGQITASVLTHEEERDSKGNLARRYNDTIRVSAGAGRLRIHQDVYDDNTSEEDRYLVNQFDTWIAVGQMTQQTYPYTWDFTETNINDKQSDSYRHRMDNNEGFGSWTGNTSEPTKGGNYVNVIETYKDDKLNVTYTKPAFAAGSELLALQGTGESKTLGAIAEAAGVGFGTSDGNNGLNNKSLSFAGKNIAIKPTSGNSQITIPGVKSDDRIYMMLDGSNYFPGGDKNIRFNVKNATLISDRNANDCQGNVFRFDATADGDVTIDCIFDGGVTIKKIAVTNLTKKTVNKYGYATESRDHAIDYKLQKELTRNYVHPYAITITDYGAVGNKGDVQVKLTEANEVKVLPERTGVVLYRDPANQTKEGAVKSDDKMQFPMFYPAMNIEESTVPEGNLMVANVEQGTTDLVEPAGSTIFFLTHTYYPYNAETKKWGSKTEAGKEIFSVYRKVSGGNNKVGANKAYLQVPATVERIWDIDPSLSGSGTAPTAKVGVIFINTDDSETTDINIVPDVPNNGKLLDTGAYYTLQGVKLVGRPTMPGIYIHNGRKEVIR